MSRRAWYLALTLAAMLVPAALAIAVFPTAMGDISENFASGRWFPLTTPEHPPMQVWVTGLVGLLVPPNAFTAIVAGQLLNLVGVYYLWLTLLLIVDPARAALFAFLFATTVYFLAAPLSYALGADIIQIPFWAGSTYHLLRASESNRWKHWLGFALWTVAAVYTKFSVAILIVGFAAASLIVPEYRRQWRNPRFGFACIAIVLLALPYFVALYFDPLAIANAEIRVGATSLFTRSDNLLRFVEGFLIFLVPGWIVVLLGLLRRDFVLVPLASTNAPPTRFLRWTFLAASAFTIALIFTIGLFYVPRFDAPLFTFLVLAGAPMVDIDRARWPVVERRVLWTAGIVAAVTFIGAAVAYTIFTSHDNMQEPFQKVTAIVRADWDRQYACGPAYYLGDRRTAHGMSIVGDLKPVGIPLADIRLVGWFHPDLLKERGATLVFRGPFPAAEVAAALPGFALTEPKAFTLPLLRTRTGQTVDYSYAFLPPANCPHPTGE